MQHEPYSDERPERKPLRRGCDGSGSPVSSDSTLHTETLDICAPEQTFGLGALSPTALSVPSAASCCTRCQETFRMAAAFMVMISRSMSAETSRPARTAPRAYSTRVVRGAVFSDRTRGCARIRVLPTIPHDRASDVGRGGVRTRPMSRSSPLKTMSILRSARRSGRWRSRFPYRCR